MAIKKWKVTLDYLFGLITTVEVEANTERKARLKAIEERYEELIPKHVITEDILASINYLLNLQ